MGPIIEVEITSDPTRLDEIVIMVRTEDGSSLDYQNTIDTLIEALRLEFQDVNESRH